MSCLDILSTPGRSSAFLENLDRVRREVLESPIRRATGGYGLIAPDWQPTSAKPASQTVTMAPWASSTSRIGQLEQMRVGWGLHPRELGLRGDEAKRHPVRSRDDLLEDRLRLVLPAVIEVPVPDAVCQGCRRDRIAARAKQVFRRCLLYTSDAADDLL